MDFRLPQVVADLQATAREFAELKLAPLVPRMEAEDLFPRELIPEMVKLAFLGLCVDKAHGGSGLGQLARTVVLEEMAHVSPACAFALAISHLGIGQIASFGSPAQQKTLLPPLARGERIITTAVTEAAVSAARRCLDVFGGHGYLAKTTPKRLWRDAICTIATSGTSEIMRTLMAKWALRGTRR